MAVPADMRLSDILRDRLGLTATKAACGIGRCGASMALLDREPANGCLLMAWQLEGARVASQEGVRDSPAGRVVEEALAAEDAFQCGYRAPGIAVALTGLLQRTQEAGREDMSSALEGSLCRCTGY